MVGFSRALESLQAGTDPTHKEEDVSCWLSTIFDSSSKLPVFAWLSVQVPSAPPLNPLGFGRTGFSSRHQMQAEGMTHPEKLRLVPRATLLIPTCHLGTEKRESAPASHPTAFWMGVSSGRRPHLQDVTLNSSAHILASPFSALLRTHICLIIPAAGRASLSTLGLPRQQPPAKGKGTACWYA